MIVSGSRVSFFDFAYFHIQEEILKKTSCSVLHNVVPLSASTVDPDTTPAGESADANMAACQKALEEMVKCLQDMAQRIADANLQAGGTVIQVRTCFFLCVWKQATVSTCMV